MHHINPLSRQILRLSEFRRRTPHLSRQHEVDFVVTSKGRVKELIQVCCRLSDDRIRKREFRSILKASDELGCQNLTVITEDEDGTAEWDGRTIRLIPLWNWLAVIRRAS